MMHPFSFHKGEALLAFAYIFLPLIAGCIHARVKKESYLDSLFLYYLFIGVGLQGVITGLMQIFFPQVVVAFTQWPTSPFLLELGMANLSYGIVGLWSLWMSRGWKVATALGYGLFLLFTGLGHVVEIIQRGFAPGNSGAFLFSDLLVALALFLLVFATAK